MTPALSIQWLPARQNHPIRAMPIYTFLIKVASRCNLNCDYCYVYNLADQTWKEKPKLLSEGATLKTIERIANHVRHHGMKKIQITLHGGEPLLFGHQRMRDFLESCRQMIPCEVVFGVQTNGTLIDTTYCDIFTDFGVRVGVSLDGDEMANARRKTPQGDSSYARAVKGIDILRSSNAASLFSGILAVIDISNDPIAIYKHLKEQKPPSMDLLLPHYDYDRPPPRPKEDSSNTAYGDWLIAVFDQWYNDAQRPSIRFFEDIIHLALGGKTSVESLGLAPVDIVVVETDGSIEALDSLKASAQGITKLGLHIETNEFDEIFTCDPIVSRISRLESLCNECQNCSIVSVCGGGYIPHRFSSAKGFLSPSIYCTDLFKLIKHIVGIIGNELDSEEARLN